MKEGIRELFQENRIAKTDLIQTATFERDGDVLGALEAADASGVRGVYVSASGKGTPAALFKELRNAVKQSEGRIAIMLDATGKAWDEELILQAAETGTDCLTVRAEHIEKTRLGLEASQLIHTLICSTATPQLPYADLTMVEGGLTSLDILSEEANSSTSPTIAYHSDWRMLEAAIAKGWLDERKVLEETMISFKRAGAACIVTPYANNVAQSL